MACLPNSIPLFQAELMRANQTTHFVLPDRFVAFVVASNYRKFMI
jgi:hypothetical protein